MPSRQDQLHSYQFMVQRVVAALVMRETDPAQSPFRRAAGATLASVLVAAIALGGVMVYGVFVGGGATDWRDEHAVIVEKESGARYVFYQDKLHPVQNYVSALLAVGAQEPRTVLVSRKSIAGVPRGAPLGIPDAPDSLPAAGQLSTQPWTICSLPDDDRHPRSAVLVGGSARGGSPLGERAVLAEHPDGSLYVVWRNRRHQVRDRALVLAALTWPDRGVRVAPALLNALPAGADLAPISIRGQGEPSDEVDGATVGEVFVVESQGGGRQYAVATRTGLAVVTEVQANLLLTENGRDEPTAMSQGDFANATKAASRVPKGDTAPPASIPDLTEPTDGAICGRVADDRGVSELRVGAEVPNLDAAAQGRAEATDTASADHVIVEPGRGVVVEAASAPGAAGGAISVVTDLGRRHPLSSAEVLPMLGYGEVRPVRMPANLVALVPAGGALDPEAVWPGGRPA
jgi:type VII secretion protein EccB